MEKKTNKPLLIIVVAAAALGLCLCCVLIFGVVYTFLPRSATGFDMKIGPGLSQTEIVPAQQFAVEPAGRLIVTNPVGDVTVQVGGSNEIIVEAIKHASAVLRADAQNHLRDTKVQAQSSGAETTVVVDIPHNLGGGSASVDLTITVPPQTQLQIKQGVGNVNVRGTEGMADVRVDVGDITINSADLSGNSVLKVNVGNVNFSGILESGDVSMSTDVGDVRVWLPADSAFQLDAEASIGSIEIDFQLSDSSSEGDGVSDEQIKGRVGQSPLLSLELRSGVGNIKVRQR